MRNDKYQGGRCLSLSPPPPTAFHCPVTRSRRETDRQTEGQRHRIKGHDLLIGPGMSVTACLEDTKNGHRLRRRGAGKELGAGGGVGAEERV